jgi:hypothetical protein
MVPIRRHVEVLGRTSSSPLEADILKCIKLHLGLVIANGCIEERPLF